MKKGDYIIINDEKYNFMCKFSVSSKTINEDFGMDVKLAIQVIRESDGKNFKWSEIKGSYLAEKIKDLVENTVNGQKQVYWDWTLEDE